MEDWPGGAATLSLADGMGGMRGRGVEKGTKTAPQSAGRAAERERPSSQLSGFSVFS